MYVITYHRENTLQPSTVSEHQNRDCLSGRVDTTPTRTRRRSGAIGEISEGTHCCLIPCLLCLECLLIFTGEIDLGEHVGSAMLFRRWTFSVRARETIRMYALCDDEQAFQHYFPLPKGCSGSVCRRSWDDHCPRRMHGAVDPRCSIFSMSDLWWSGKNVNHTNLSYLICRVWYHCGRKYKVFYELKFTSKRSLVLCPYWHSS